MTRYFITALACMALPQPLPVDIDFSTEPGSAEPANDHLGVPGYTANDHRMSTLEEALARFPHRLLNLELKPDLQGNGDYEAQMASLLQALLDTPADQRRCD